MATRIEKDSLGELQVPANALYGVHTQRSIHNFEISSRRLHTAQIRALAQIKQACALANMELGILEKKKGEAIIAACKEIAEGKHHEALPLDIFQAGSGTSSNMNINEVIAYRAAERMGGKRGDRGLVHPNDDVNKGQSTNNVFPSSIRVAGLDLSKGLLDALKVLVGSLEKKARQFKRIVKSGRTHLQDAVPVTLGQAFQAHASALKKDLERIRDTDKFLRCLGVGGNAIGTGLNTYAEFRPLIMKHLSKITGRKYEVPADPMETTQYLTDMAHLSAVLRLTAIDIGKLCNDLRLMVSGPNTGLNEISLPAVEPGSSIMPGKINPSICEAVNMVCIQVIGNDAAVSAAAAAGQLELNTHMPVLGSNLLESLDILTQAALHLARKCVDGITANVERCRWYVENSPSIATALNPYIGYDKAAAVVKESLKTRKPIPEVILEQGYLSREQLKEVLDPIAMTQPNLTRKPAKKKKR
ncbi:MAG: fumarate hydratase class II [Candidatus Hinthialibacteria bacterium]|nr:aspartate ammonia-lyase [Candidatus Omnitrophota bacterium]